MMRYARQSASATIVAMLALGLVTASGSPAAAVVDVGDGLHGVYDGCIAKFTAAGLRDLVDQLDRSRNVFVFRKSAGTMTNPAWASGDDSENGRGSGGTTKWNPDDTSPLPGGHVRDACATLYHEMSHLADYDKGTNQKHECTYAKDGRKASAGTTAGEVKATRKENEYRKTQPGLKNDLRTTYNGSDPLPPDGTSCDPAPPPPPARGCSVGCAIGAGDPHLRTFDGVYYDFHAVGEFVLVGSAGGDLEIQGRQEPLSGLRTVSYYSAVAANVAGDRVGVYRRAGAVEIRVGAEVVDLPVTPLTLPRGGSVAAYGDGSIDVRWPDGSVLNARPAGGTTLSLSVQLADARRGTVRGLFGDFDGRTENDLTVRDGAVLTQPPSFERLYPSFADSWRITAAASLFAYSPGQSTDTFTDRSLPERPVQGSDLPNQAAAEAVCRQAGVTEDPALQWCVLDVGLTGDPTFARDAVATQRLTSTTGATTLAVTRAGGTARLTFAGTEGQRVFVDVVSTDLPDQCGLLTLRAPDGTFVAGGCVIGGEGLVDSVVLPATGDYELVLDPADNSTGTARVRVVTSVDQRLATTPDGGAVIADVRQPGGVSAVRFTAAAGTKVFVDVLSSDLPDQCGVLTLRDPAGGFLAGGCVIGGRGSVDGTTLPTAGEYLLTVDPAARGTGTARLRIIAARDQTGTVSVNGPPVTATVGQPGAVSVFGFTGTAGQRITVEVTGSTLPDACGVLMLRDPSGDFVASGCVINGTGGIAVTALPTAGRYTVAVDPAERGTGTAELRLR